MKNLLACFALLALAAITPAQAASGLAVVTRDASVAGKLVKDVSPVALYATPKAGDYVRVAPTAAEVWTIGVWTAFSALAPADKYEICTTGEVAEDTPVGVATCTAWNLKAVVPAYGQGIAALRWDTTTQNTDGSPLTNLAGYRVYYGTASTPNQTIDVGNVTAFTVTLLTPGPWFFAVTTLAADGAESGMSAIVTKTIPAPPTVPTTPKPPGSVTVADAEGWDLVKTPNKVTMVVKGTVSNGVSYRATVVTDATGVYQQVSVGKTTFKPLSGSTIPQTIFVKLVP